MSEMDVESELLESSEKPAFALGSLVLGLAAQGDLRWAVVDLSQVVEAARLRLDLSPIATAALGRALSGVALLQGLATRTPRKMVLEIKGDGPLAQVVVEIDQAGNVRGSVAVPHVHLPDREDGKLAVGDAVGKGRLRVFRHAQDGSTYQSEVQLQDGEIGLDLAHYLEQSEQTRSAVLVGVLAGPEGVRAAGGLIVEALPGSPEGVLVALEGNLGRLEGLSSTLARVGLDGLIAEVFSGLEAVTRERHPLAYRCPCNRERLRHHLAAIAATETESLADEEGQVSVACVFCGEMYVFQAGELEVN